MLNVRTCSADYIGQGKIPMRNRLYVINWMFIVSNGRFAMDSSRDPDEPQSGERPEDRDEGRCGARKCPRTAPGAGWLMLMLALFSTISVVHSYLPDKYPIEVYHMLQERTQYGIGRENRVRGSWGPWSSWRECSRSCGTGVQSQARECVPARGTLRKRSALIGGQRISDANQTKPMCIGTYKRYHICNTQDCPNFPEDLRAEQCATYNNKIYKGQSYLWVPFLNAPNPCALNCRAVGQRFYATLEPAVIDGTPCDGPNLRGHSTGMSMDKTEHWLCVAGQCRPVGCDGVVGSGAIRDTCGVCGGVGMGCKLYEGIFMEPIMPKGHQPVTMIPRGAMSLNISELRSSGNYLALRGKNGSYILNGPLSLSPSGTYKVAGTSLTYQRGDRTRMESIVATGPLNESLTLEISYHELNPGILYKYMLPLMEQPDGGAMIAPPLRAIGSSDQGNDIPASDPAQSDENPQGLPGKRSGVEVDSRKLKTKKDMKYLQTTAMAGDAPKTILLPAKKNTRGKKKFAWKVKGLSPCSKACGGGLQSAILKCVRQASGIVVNERRCRHVEKPENPPPLRCNDRPCAARWRADSWSECSVTCGTGIQTRKLECVQELNAKLTMRVAAGACVQPPDLRTVEACTKGPCLNSTVPEVRRMQTQLEMPRWNVGPWSPCSATCGQGVRNRTVTCITTGEPCSFANRPETDKICESQSCDSQYETPNVVWMYTEWSPKCSAKCGSGFETRRLICSHANELFCESKPKPETKRVCVLNGVQTLCNIAEWFTGPWSSCTADCGIGEQRRDVLCVKKIDGESRIVPEGNCASAKPDSEQICVMPNCTGKWFMSDWSECSTKCGGGTRSRTVRCMSGSNVVSTCSQNTKPHETARCNLETCKVKHSSSPSKIPKKFLATGHCVDKYPNCGLVVKTGLCRIKYYKHSCCGCRE